MTAERSGQVITFYSYKGGVGRSMALANVAALLAQRGNKVLAVDFDFEAPGLHRYFLSEGSKFERYKPKNGALPGTIDFFYDLREHLSRLSKEAGGPVGLPVRAAVLREMLDAGRYRYQIQLWNPNRKPGTTVTVDFMAAGRFDADYTERVRQFDWSGFYAEHGEILPLLAEELGRHYDYILVDSRTGVTDIGSICTMVLPEKLVLVFAPNVQSLNGALEVGRQAVIQRMASEDLRPLPLFPLLSRVEEGEEKQKQKWVEDAQARFQTLFREVYALRVCDLSTYFNIVRIPHRSFYAYGERIAAEERPTEETGSLSSHFLRFIECLDCDNPNEAQHVLERQQEEAEREIVRKLSDEGELQRLIQQHEDRPEPRMFLAQLLASQGRQIEALRTFQEIASRFSDDTEKQEWVARALFAQGVTLAQLRRPEEALSVYQDVIRRFGDATEPALREPIARALFNQGLALDQLGRPEEALSVYQDTGQPGSHTGRAWPAGGGAVGLSGRDSTLWRCHRTRFARAGCRCSEWNRLPSSLSGQRTASAL
ncbi:MAG TPA: AAA family ATPase [Polyangia bacterium]|nr:AAA family ATPase [Polyangia bacterium]